MTIMRVHAEAVSRRAQQQAFNVNYRGEDRGTRNGTSETDVSNAFRTELQQNNEFWDPGGLVITPVDPGQSSQPSYPPPPASPSTGSPASKALSDFWKNR